MEKKCQKKYLWKSVIGWIVFDESFNIIARGSYDELKKDHPGASEDFGPETEKKVLKKLENEQRLKKEFYIKNLELTKRQIKESVSDDNLIIQAVGSIDEIDKAANILAKRLREWYELYNPEFSYSLQSHEKFTELILKKTRKELLDELKVEENRSMGADLEEEDLNQIKELAAALKSMYEVRKKHEEYIERVMEKAAPNVKKISGSMIGARLIAQAGSLERLSEFPASTVQLLGAEKALFRHMKTGARCPKFGIIYMHPLVSASQKRFQGKAARILADKISIAAKVDFFKGGFVGDKLLDQVKDKIKGMKR